MQINSTALRILTVTNRLSRGISNALTCGNIPPDQYCSNVLNGFVDLYFNPHRPVDMLGIYRLLFLSLFVRMSASICNGYLRRGLTQGDEIWQDGTSGWVAGHLLFFVNFGP